MAEATVSDRVVRPEVVIPAEVEKVFTLELSEDEAVALATVLRRVGGDPSGMRGQIDNVAKALRLAGVRHVDSAHDDRVTRSGIRLK